MGYDMRMRMQQQMRDRVSGQQQPQAQSAPQQQYQSAMEPLGGFSHPPPPSGTQQDYAGSGQQQQQYPPIDSNPSYQGNYNPSYASSAPQGPGAGSYQGFSGGGGP